ncbi:MAG: chemotaxis protein CheW [Chloroherpetonaceae bacterium]|nr:chemotaxis protein CheW [Chloroherpetonaceae bacterium]MDW8436691.1 chemotaxis protein CheW [Chloroherpetonaceae bacterium]
MNNEQLAEQLARLNFTIPAGVSLRDLEGMASVLERLKALGADKTDAATREDEEAREQFIAVLIGEREVGFRVVDIEAILDVQKITPVPGLPNFVLGVCNVRGEITSVVDIHRIFGIEARRQKTRRQKAAEKMVILRNNKFSVACVVDAVLDVFRVAEPDIEKVNAADGEMERLAPFARGLYVRPDAAGKRDEVILIDTKKLLDSPEMTQFQ